MAIEISKERPAGTVEQRMVYESGNEMAAYAAHQINYHVMGYFPISPSTEVAQFLDLMKANGQHDIKLIPADGEHGSAGICYGASVAGGRVFNVTSANGFLYMLEQLPVQSGTRFPMVMNLVCRSVSGPLNIHGDHSDLYYALNTGWPILLARDPQAVYDMNIMAIKLAEHPDVRLPVIVASDGYFTSHQKRRVQTFAHREDVLKFIGEQPPEGFPHVLDRNNPITVGPYMNEPDFINNRYQQSEAMYRAADVFEEIRKEYAVLTGRDYPKLDLYRMEDAEVAVFLLNSASEIIKDVVDQLRAKGVKAGAITPNIIRPFPQKEIAEALKNVKAVTVGDRADSYGAYGGNMTLEVKAALFSHGNSTTKVISRVYGLGGKDFYAEDGHHFFELAIDAAEKGYVEKPFDYYGHTPGDPAKAPKRVLEPMKYEDLKTGLITVEKDEETGKLKVKVPPLRNLTKKPKRLAPGHGACPGCGIFSGLELFFKGIEGDIVALFQTGCAMVVTTGYPYSSHKATYIHNLFQNGAATLSGVVEMFWERKRRGELDHLGLKDDFTFVMITGDGGMDIGMGPAIGAALRNHKMIILEYDNEGYMNTGAQLSYSTPLGHRTSTSNVGKHQGGKLFHHKDTPQIMAATNIPYVFTGAESQPLDLVRKAAKAQYYAQNEGLVYGKILITCPLNWLSEEKIGQELIDDAVNSCFFPLYEVEHGVTNITYNPEEKGKRIPVSDWLKRMGKTRHLARPEYAEALKSFEDEVERRWQRLKAKHENPYL
ncbi:MAG: pyruvate synthase [Thermobacillus sp.]|jgi:pyruvate ferredoxin oxidoreductase alpha subunit|uniref:2-oxoacid:ferredoxin oxidoreductase, alpha subunit n=2 Tax=Thermobacillus TaxID=76632 RepID=L0EDZ9_THECK|nr:MULTISPECIES: thiamine pyrophosphate-dependent enzyme [Thermobacillus]AGA57834.1 2-oxoacid:ferredoxin oxidoreductase, alpha subunit [Thermobacillus composti KWC4]REJ20787.1 MAG: pyruvate synthase [Paenibacillaceae bacterium]REK56770.1 MAG: pyruvate synthase [Thermobacillus sp.]CAG5079376.1 Pyruvate synthase subunit PorA, Pyruvate flavodoxin/ferredoxin oxidoreductase domain protein [Thermobacillus xylanilyticus]